MIVYGIKPLIPNGDVPPDIRSTFMYDRLFQKPARDVRLNTLGAETTIPVADGFILRVERNKYDVAEMHPVDALITQLNFVRGSHMPDELIIPGQTLAHSYVAAGPGPTEGVVVVFCGSDDWTRERLDTELDWDPVPGLLRLENREQVHYREAQRGSYVTADSRGMIIDYELEFDHAGLDVEYAEELSDEEASPFLVDFTVQHALRTLDVRQAARCIDELSDAATPREQAVGALDALRRIQLRLAARGVESVLQNRHWQSFIGHDAFRMAQITQGETARADRALSERFTAMQPIIEAAAAQARRAQDLALAESRRLEQESRAAVEAEREKGLKRVTNLAAALIGGVALIGLFAALAAIPVQGGTFSPYIRAAFVAIALGGTVGGYAWLLDKALVGQPPSESAGRALRRAGIVFVCISVAIALLGWIYVENPSVWLLFTALGLLALGVLAATFGYEPGGKKPKVG